jgi:hypothetical protein
MLAILVKSFSIIEIPQWLSRDEKQPATVQVPTGNTTTGTIEYTSCAHRAENTPYGFSATLTAQAESLFLPALQRFTSSPFRRATPAWRKGFQSGERGA